jgi:TetR/AcrR family transcriptional regulator, tetracycline repressor protein
VADAPIPSPPWAPARRSEAVRREQPLTREAIVETALAVLDRDGLDALSMRSVAAELKTGAAALYRHVANKDELLDLVFDHVIGEFEVPDPEPQRWAEQVKEVARAVRAGILRHRDIVRISMGRYPMGPNGLRLAERLLAIFRAGGLPDRTATVASHLMFVVINGFSLEDAGPVGGPGASPDEVNAMITDYIASLPPERFPNLVAVAPVFMLDDLDARFDLLLDLFVDGLARHATESTKR